MTSPNAHKSSSLRFVQSIPAHWIERRAKFFFKEVNERALDGGEELLSVSHITGVTRRSEKNVTMIMAETTEGYKVCRPGDLAINTLWAWMGALGVSKEHGVVSPAYGVYRQREPKAYRDRFADLLLRTPVFVAEYNTRSRGVQESRLRLYPESFLDIPLPCPSLAEQDAIVQFLEDKEHNVGYYLATKRKMIEQLGQYRAQAISAFVPQASQSNPGGSYRRLRECVDVVGGMTPPIEKQEFWGGDVAWVTPKDMKQDVIHDSIDHITKAALSATSLRIIPRGAVLMVVRGMILARVVPVAVTDIAVTVNQDMKALVPRPGVDGRYLANLLSISQELLSTLVDEAGHGTKRLPTQRWRDLWIFLPSQGEQLAIVKRAESCRLAIDQAIGSIEREITVMEEYRTRLIADAVTGQIDVRRAG